LAEAFQKEPSSNSASVVPAPSRTVFEDEQAYFQAIVSTYTANLEKMHSFASARKAKYIVAFQPELGSKIARSYDETKILEQWNAAFKYSDRSFSDKYRQLVRYAKSFCDQNGILYVDVNDDEMFAQNSKTLFYDAVHPNEEGHRIIAE